MMKANMALVLQALLCLSLMCACPCPVQGVRIPKTAESNSDASKVEAVGINDSKPTDLGFSWGMNGDTTHAGTGKSISWLYKGSHGVGWNTSSGACKMGCCAPFAGHCKYCCHSLAEAEAYKQIINSKNGAN